MGAEIGATTSLFPFNNRMSTYLRATGRGGEWGVAFLEGLGGGVAWVVKGCTHVTVKPATMSGQEKV